MRTVIATIAFLLASQAPASDAFAQSKPMTDIAAPRSACCDQMGDPPLAGFLSKSESKFCIGKHLELQLGGFARLDLIHDFDPIGDRYEFVTTSIPTDGRTGQRTTVSVRQTRFNLDVLHIGNSVHLFAEGDFFGDGGDFRLRLGYGEIRGVLVGQNWSTFQDESIIPATLDYEGPVGMIFVRQPQLRLTLSPDDRIEFAFSMQDASQSGSKNVDIPFPGTDNHRLPDFVGRLRYEMPSGHVQRSPRCYAKLDFRATSAPTKGLLAGAYR